MKIPFWVILATISCVQLQIASADTIQDSDPDFEAIRERVSYPIYNYDLTVQTGESSDAQAVTRVDMAKPKGQRIKLVSSTDSKLSEAVMEKFRYSDGLGDVWCDQLTDKVPDAYATIKTSPGTKTISFVPVAETDEEKSIFPNLVGEMTIDTQTQSVTGLKLTNTSPFKPSPIAKVKALEIIYTCETLENGLSAMVSYSANVKGTALFQSFEETEIMLLSNFQPTGSK